MRVAALLAYRGDARNRLAAAPQIRPFARQIHPRLVPFRRDHRLIHGAVAVIDRAHFILRTGLEALRAKITRRFAERAFDHALSGNQARLR